MILKTGVPKDAGFFSCYYESLRRLALNNKRRLMPLAQFLYQRVAYRV